MQNVYLQNLLNLQNLRKLQNLRHLLNANQQIAKITSAAYFRATDSAKLEFIYQEIDQMETTRMETTYFQHFRETAGVFLLPTAIALLLLEIVLSQTKLRRLP